MTIEYEDCDIVCAQLNAFRNAVKLLADEYRRLNEEAERYASHLKVIKEKKFSRKG